MGLYAILIAGGTLPRSLRGAAASPVKALLPVGGRSLLERAARAAVDSGLFAGIAAVGNAEVQRATPAGCLYIPLGETMVDNIVNAYNHFGGDAHDYVVISPDLPFITVTGLRQFAGDAANRCELGCCFVSREDFLRCFPGAPNRFEKIDGGFATMGSVFYATGAALRMNIALLHDMYTARKRPWRLAVFLGLPILFALLSGRLRLEAVEQRLSLLAGNRVRAIPCPEAGLAYDIDTAENLAFAEGLLKTGHASA